MSLSISWPSSSQLLPTHRMSWAFAAQWRLRTTSRSFVTRPGSANPSKTKTKTNPIFCMICTCDSYELIDSVHIAFAGLVQVTAHVAQGVQSLLQGLHAGHHGGLPRGPKGGPVDAVHADLRGKRQTFLAFSLPHRLSVRFRCLSPPPFLAFSKDPTTSPSCSLSFLHSVLRYS